MTSKAVVIWNRGKRITTLIVDGMEVVAVEYFSKVGGKIISGAVTLRIEGPLHAR